MICLAKRGSSVSYVWVSKKKKNQVKYYVFFNPGLLGKAASSMSELTFPSGNGKLKTVMVGKKGKAWRGRMMETCGGSYCRNARISIVCAASLHLSELLFVRYM